MTYAFIIIAIAAALLVGLYLSPYRVKFYCKMKMIFCNYRRNDDRCRAGFPCPYQTVIEKLKGSETWRGK